MGMPYNLEVWDSFVQTQLKIENISRGLLWPMSILIILSLKKKKSDMGVFVLPERDPLSVEDTYFLKH